MSASEEKRNKGLAALQHATNAWALTADGEYFCAGNSLLQPVLYEHRSAMLKVPLSGSGKAQTGFRLLDCWAGKSAVTVYKYDADALLMERATGDRSLRQMVLDGREDEANRIVCKIVQQLHTSSCTELPPLTSWFQTLATAAAQQGGNFVTCHKIADALLRDPQNTIALHGDIHYDNILDAGHKGWLAIDPKGVIGERGFDYANLFCNPTIEIATSPARLPRQIPLIAARANLEPQRLLRWIIAWSGLMAAWMLEDAEQPTLPLSVAELAIAQLQIF
jgi:streptomycin 6-kinase